METKVCSKCGEEKELGEFYFNKRTNSYRSMCKACWKYNNKQYRDIKRSPVNILRRNIDQKNSLLKNSKICYVCNFEKPLSDFHFRKDNKKYRNECKECFNAKIKNSPNRKEKRKKFIFKKQRKRDRICL